MSKPAGRRRIAAALDGLDPLAYRMEDQLVALCIELQGLDGSAVALARLDTLREAYEAQYRATNKAVHMLEAALEAARRHCAVARAARRGRAQPAMPSEPGRTSGHPAQPDGINT